MKENQWVEKYLKGDKVIWLILFFLSMASVLIVYSTVGALAYRQTAGNTWIYFWKQMFFTISGFVAVWILTKWHESFFRVIKKYSLLLLAISATLSVIAFLLKDITGGAGRSIPLGFMSFQPAEITKITLAVFVANVLSNSQGSNEKLRKAFFISLGATAVSSGIIFFADFSTFIIIASSVMVILWVGRVPKIYLFGTIGAGAILGVLLYFAVDKYPIIGEKIGRLGTMHSRIEKFINSDNKEKEEKLKAYKFEQEDYARMAIANGGFLIGQGIGDSRYANLMSAAYNDFVYAIFLEEYGGLFGIFILLLFFILLTRGGVIIRSSQRIFPAFLTAGLVFQLVFQAMINMGVAVGFVPTTGQPLPWVSMGGSSRILTGVAFGLILCASILAKKKKESLGGEREAPVESKEQSYVAEEIEMI